MITKPIDAITGPRKPTTDNTTHFPISRVNRLRKQAERARQFDIEECSEEWSRSIAAPMKLLAVFKSLRIKPGFVLRAYQFRGGLNGNGVVWAMPSDAPFPEPAECASAVGSPLNVPEPKSVVTQGFIEPPKPPMALDDFMSAVEGDGTPWSFVSASLFSREAWEFGAFWHGCNWSSHRILGADPWSKAGGCKDGHSFSVGDKSEWTWHEQKPSEWQPSVALDGNVAVVTFYTFSGLGQRSITRYSDLYRPDSLCFKCTASTAASAEGGYVY